MLRPRRLGCSGARRGVRAATCDVSIGVPVTTSPGAAAAFARAGADQFALGKPAEHGQHQAPVRGRRIGLRAEGGELFLRIAGETELQDAGSSVTDGQSAR
jgi:hypothetical protein